MWNREIFKFLLLISAISLAYTAPVRARDGCISEVDPESSGASDTIPTDLEYLKDIAIIEGGCAAYATLYLKGKLRAEPFSVQLDLRCVHERGMYLGAKARDFLIHEARDLTAVEKANFYEALAFHIHRDTHVWRALLLPVHPQSGLYRAYYGIKGYILAIDHQGRVYGGKDLRVTEPGAVLDPRVISLHELK